MPTPVFTTRKIRSVSGLGPVLWTLLFATIGCVGMLGTRLAVGQSPGFTFLVFNLFLAWIPLGLSLFLRKASTPPGWRRHLFWMAGLLWIVFYPNSFYIVTDLVHLRFSGTPGVPFWFDMMMTVGFAFTGVFLGSLALYLLHIAISERYGFRMGWGFSMVILALGSFGIYVGRFLRWNSWEVFTHPTKLVGQVGLLVHESDHVLAFSFTFFFFSLMAYFFVVAMARLHESEV